MAYGTDYDMDTYQRATQGYTGPFGSPSLYSGLGSPSAGGGLDFEALLPLLAAGLSSAPGGPVGASGQLPLSPPSVGRGPVGSMSRVPAGGQLLQNRMNPQTARLLQLIMRLGM